MNSIPEPLQQVERTYVLRRGRKLSYFAGCDYHRLSSHPVVLRAAAEAVSKYGLNVAASRMTTGNHLLYGKLESALEDFFGAESATLASNGYQPNLMVAQALKGNFSHALLDERAHGCLADASQMLDCPVIRFRHRDPSHLAQILKRLGNVSPLLLTDGVFAYNGAIAPIPDYLDLMPKAGMILIDDAHGAGVIGKSGRGSPEFHNVSRKRIIQTMTLSKAFGVYGGAVLGAKRLRQNILDKSNLFSGNTPLPLPLAHAACESLKLLQKKPSLLRSLRKNIDLVRSHLGLNCTLPGGNQNPIIAVICQNSWEVRKIKQILENAQIHAPFIHYPGGPRHGYFRFALSGSHEPSQLENLIDVLKQLPEACFERDTGEVNNNEHRETP